MKRILDFLHHGATAPAGATRALGAALALLLATAPGAAHALSIGLSATSGAVVTVTVSVEGVEALAEPSLGAYDLDLFFDDSVLAFADIDFGPYLGAPDDSFQSVNTSSGLVDFAEVSLLFPNVLLQDLQPDAFVLATLTFDALVEVDTLTTVGLSQTLLSDGAGDRIQVDPVASIELVAAIPEVGGAHVFALGALLALVGHWLFTRGAVAPAAARPAVRRATLRPGS